MDYQLVIVRGRSANQTVRLGNGITTVGRHEDCQLRIGSSQVSRKHCQLYERQGQLIVIDLGSSNGTFVNGKKISGQKVLSPGDVLGLGKVKFRVEKLGRPQPSDTAVAEAVLSVDEGDEEEFDIDFDDESEDRDTTVSQPTSATPATGGSSEDVPAQKKKPAPAAEPAPEPEPAPAMGDDAVADFLMNIDLDDEDKH